MKTPDGLVDKIVEQINDVISQGKASKHDIEQNLKSLVQAQLTKLDVVSREDFEIQQQVLEKSRTQIDQLKTQIEMLEKRIDAL